MVLALAAVGCGLAAWLLAGPILRADRERRLARFLANGEVARGRSDFPVWWANLRAAREISASDPRVVRGMAEQLTHFRLSGGLAYWRTLEQLGGMRWEDRFQWARLALALERTDIAREALLPLHARNPRDPAVLVLISELFEQDGDLARARAAATEAAGLAPRDVGIELRLAALELADGSPAAVARGKAMLVALLAGRTAGRADAGFLFLRVAGGSVADRQLLRQLLGDVTGGPFAEQVLALALAATERPESAEQLGRDFAQRHGLEAPTPQLIHAAEQLGRLGETRPILTLVPERLALQDGELCRLRLGALAAARDEEGMLRLLARPDLPLAGFARAVFEAGVAQMAGRTNQALRLWPKAIAACMAQPGALSYLARHAEAVGAPEVAIEAWQAQLADTFLAPKAAVQVIRLASRRRDFLASSAALHRLTQLRPEAWDAHLSLAFAQLMLDRRVPETGVTLSWDPGRFVSPDFHLVTQALQHLRNDLPDQSLGTLDRVRTDWSEAPLAWRIVRIAALGRSGQSHFARQLGRELPADELSAPEMALVRDWLPARTDAATVDR